MGLRASNFEFCGPQQWSGGVNRGYGWRKSAEDGQKFDFSKSAQIQFPMPRNEFLDLWGVKTAPPDPSRPRLASPRMDKFDPILTNLTPKFGQNSMNEFYLRRKLASNKPIPKIETSECSDFRQIFQKNVRMAISV